MRETRKTVRDSERDLHKMSIGHHLGERGRIVERRRLRGEDEEHRNFVGMHGGLFNLFINMIKFYIVFC